MNQQMLIPQWYELLKPEFEKPYFEELRLKLVHEYTNYKCYPAPNEIFRAFNVTPPDTVKVIMLGQDPYPNGDHADGIAFSSKQRETPFSLQRIFREIDRQIIKTQNKQEFNRLFPTNDLSKWAQQGVLLLNSALTVQAGSVGSHHHLGWDKFIGSILKLLWERGTNKVFVLLGKDAKNVFVSISSQLGDKDHLIVEAGHPASGAHGEDSFSGTGIFFKTNRYLVTKGLEPINWTLNG